MSSKITADNRFVLPLPLRRAVSVLGVVALVAWLVYPATVTRAAGIDAIAVVLVDSEATSTETSMTVTFTPTTAFTTASTISIYLGENTGGEEFTDADADQDGTDISCVQTGSTFENGSQADASETVPMLYAIEVASVTTGDGEVVCTLGTGATDGPTTPTLADGYSVAVVTENDSGAGIAYVGNANDVTVSVTVLPNLSLTVSTPDETYCTTTDGVTSCNLGTVLTTTENSGSYDVDVGTNAASGATVYVAEDGDLRNGTDTIDDVSDGDITAGAEEYGIIVTETGSAWTVDATYAATEAPVITGPDVVATSSAPVDASTSNVDITHRVAVASSTLALTYSHIVTWTAAANF